jgi:drug/metabolite transporter (DMT)-like permease
MSCAVVFIPLAVRHLVGALVGRVLCDGWARALTAALISLGGYGLILKALETAPTRYVVTARQKSVLFVLVFSALLLKERPGWLRISGGAIMVLGVALIAIRAEGARWITAPEGVEGE